MNKIAAAKEIEATYRGITGGGETISLLKIWNEIGGAAIMTWTDFEAGVKHLATRQQDSILMPALYPWQYRKSELDAVVVYGAQECNTLYII